MANITRNNHYVPQATLKRWSHDGQSVWAYRLLVSHNGVRQWRSEPIARLTRQTDLYTERRGGRDVDTSETFITRDFEEPGQKAIEKLLAGARISPPIIRANVITQLPQEPDGSDVDVHLEPNIPPVLTEDVRQTLAGAMGSVRTLIEALAEHLIGAWEWRKANQDALQQPRAQWPRIGEEARAGRLQPFVGYAPGTHQYEPGQLMSHPRTMRKMAAAALFDHQRHQWPNFD